MELEEIKVNRGFKHEGKLYGRFEVQVNGDTYFIIANNDDVRILQHFIGNSVKECLSEPKDKFKKLFLEKAKSLVKEVTI